MSVTNRTDKILADGGLRKRPHITKKQKLLDACLRAQLTPKSSSSLITITESEVSSTIFLNYNLYKTHFLAENTHNMLLLPPTIGQ